MTNITLDILAFSAHPDDVEISCGATLIKSISQGMQAGIIDITAGELGSRGSKVIRLKEAEDAAKILGLTIRENLNLRDCFFQSDESTLKQIISKIRQYKPRLVLCNSPSDRHPDHARASALVRDASYYAGLSRIETFLEGQPQEEWRPKIVLQYIQDYYLKPDLVLDISGLWEQKVELLKCFSSQFHNPNTSGPTTPISGAGFFDFLYGKALNFGRQAGYPLGEGFVSDRYIGLSGLDRLI